jgi:hypothetical protein
MPFLRDAETDPRTPYPLPHISAYYTMKCSKKEAVIVMLNANYLGNGVVK